ncbi:tectonin beta-propeller repeat-containing protein 2-like, partial [Diretmus argenteus]
LCMFYCVEVIIGALESSGDIVSVSCCENEIFILKGDRDIIRLSNSPEGLASNLSEISFCMSSPLTTPTILPPTGSVETAQPIRTMAIIVEGGGRGVEVGERRGYNGEDEEDEEEGVEEVEEAGEQEEAPSVATSGSRSRSSSITSWDSTYGNAAMTTSSELSSRRYSAPLGQEELQQELVVKAIRVKKKTKRRRQDSCSGNRLSESSWSESMFVVQDGGCSDGGSGTPLSDRTSLLCSSLDYPEQDQDQNQIQVCHNTEHGAPDSGGEEGGGAESSSSQTSSHLPPASLPLHGLEGQLYPEKGSLSGVEVVPPTPDVDLLLECTFSYMHNAEQGDGQEQQPMEHQDDEFLSPLIGPDEEEEEAEDLLPPNGLADQMFYSTVSRLDRQPSGSSDEEEDIYGYTAQTSSNVGDGLSCLSIQTDGQMDQDRQDKDRHKPDQLAESWMGYSGPGCGILSLQVTDRHVWCLDFKGGLFCSPLPETGLNWQRFEDNVHQVALSPSGSLLWKVEQKSMTAYACAKVTIKGKRHWYKAVEQTAFVALSDDAAWIIRTNGDLYLQT